MSNKTKISIAISIILLAAASRLIKHPFNFTPVIAMALFAGHYVKKRWAVILPLGGMLASDYFLGFYEWQVMTSVYASIALAFVIGWYLQKRLKWWSLVFASLTSSIVFFVITNFAVWAFTNWYPHTWQGLANDFTLALPFFRNSLLGDLMYSGLFFGAYELILLWLNKMLKFKNA